jgi:hypothetical protein
VLFSSNVGNEMFVKHISVQLPAVCFYVPCDYMFLLIQYEFLLNYCLPIEIPRRVKEKEFYSEINPAVLEPPKQTGHSK